MSQNTKHPPAFELLLEFAKKRGILKKEKENGRGKDADG